MSRLALAAVFVFSGSLSLTSSRPGAESGADFLESVIRRMQQDRFISSGEDLSDYPPTPLSPEFYEQHQDSQQKDQHLQYLQHHQNPQHPQHPQLHDQQQHQQEHNLAGDAGNPPLTKGELLALYQAAVAKGTGLDLSALPQLPLAASSDTHQQQHSYDEPVSPSDQGSLPGYYYYFYPINSFLDHNGTDSDMGSYNHSMMAMAPLMDDNAMAMSDMKIDPLFLAMAGFVSMATLVSFSILFLPKFGDTRSWQKAALKNIPEDEDEMFSLSRVVGQAMQGRDCADRLACELGRAIRTMQLGQKPIRVLEAMLPPRLSKQMAQVRLHMVKKDKCHDISCKPKSKPSPKAKPKLKPKPKQTPNNVKKQTNTTSH